MNELALFAGAGGGIIASHMLGWRTICAVERDAYAAQVLAQRQNDGAIRPFPIWSDVRSFDGRPWRGRIDVISGGFPCQDISVAGRGAGIDGERSGMWVHMARIIGDVRPQLVYVENSPAILTRGLERVLGDLAALGYDCRWTVLGASNIGAPHKRERLWLLAYPAGVGQSKSRDGKDAFGRSAHQKWEADNAIHVHGWATEPGMGRMAYGVAHRMERLKAIGNGQVPKCAVTAFRMLAKGIAI